MRLLFALLLAAASAAAQKCRTRRFWLDAVQDYRPDCGRAVRAEDEEYEGVRSPELGGFVGARQALVPDFFYRPGPLFGGLTPGGFSRDLMYVFHSLSKRFMSILPNVFE